MGEDAALGAWRVSDIVTDTVERFREVRREAGGGVFGVNRNLSRLRAVFNWAVRVGYLDHAHSVWRDFDGDFGRDLLAAHYQDYPHQLADD